jgi:peptide chain release factor 3
MTELQAEVARRRTFAIISHPDAGKTTLTEKLLLYGGAIQLAGSVRARKNQRHATSDWMAMERQRGISITSTVLQFPYAGCQVNLLDTPGHQDFSEDTYRTLAAVDSAVMIIDAANGVEAQTRKLFRVCRQRGIPIFTFINKMDRPAREPLHLLGEIEEVLGIGAAPMNWPVGDGPEFRGVFDRRERQLHLFDRTERGERAAPVTVVGPEDPALESILPTAQLARLREEIELLDMAGEAFDEERLYRGEVTPVFFGSAVTNFGVKLFFDRFVELAPPPGPMETVNDGVVCPDAEEFSGFVFKIQANMDPMHRDRVAFLRVCSGRFERDMQVLHPRLGRKIRLTRPHKLFAQGRETIEEAYAGDVIGLTNPGLFAIGDTVSSGRAVRFGGIPRFAPEHFASLQNRHLEKYKQFQKGLEQLGEEGAIQVFYPRDGVRREPVLAAVGQLQFEVVQFRLQSEYGVETGLMRLPFELARWVTGPADDLRRVNWAPGARPVEDADGRLVGLFDGRWALEYTQEKNPSLEFHEIAPSGATSAVMAG